MSVVFAALFLYNKIMKYILAVSGGVDSVVLLDMINSILVKSSKQSPQTRSLRPDDFIVAHFDHGIRKESARDAEFVGELSQKYDLPFVLGKAKLGKNASEESARKSRYDFLRSVCAGQNSAQIVTAHHQDDLIETIVMNILRGTGWRGLSPFWSDDILRPLIKMNKAEIVRYAIENNLEWVEDETNYNSKYFRNRVRTVLNAVTPKQKKELIKLNAKQNELRFEAEKMLQNIPILLESVPANTSEVKEMDDAVAIEVLNKMTEGKLTTPQIIRLLKFLRTAKSGDICQPGGGVQITLKRGNMITRTNLKK